MKWEEIAELQVYRVDSIALKFQNHVYVVGGYQYDNGPFRTFDVEVYNEKKN